MKFSWDIEKEEDNFKKHRVSFKEGSTVFSDPLSVTSSDFHPYEERWITVGVSDKNRFLYISHLEKDDEIRIISARTLTKQELKNYEEGI